MHDIEGRAEIYHGDAVETLYALPPASVDFIFADPPYFLSTAKGTTCRGGQRVRVAKGRWDRPTTPEQQRGFGLVWLAAARRVLKPAGSLVVSGTSHSIHDVHTAAVGGLGMHVVNEIVWEKPNPPPNLGRRALTHASETLLWLSPRQRGYFFDYAAMREENGGKQMRTVWRIPPPRGAERARGGKHPAQKPEQLLERCLRMACPIGGRALDPFAGSGTTAAAALQLGRSATLIDADAAWVEVAHRRLLADLARAA